MVENVLNTSLKIKDLNYTDGGLLEGILCYWRFFI